MAGKGLIFDHGDIRHCHLAWISPGYYQGDFQSVRRLAGGRSSVSPVPGFITAIDGQLSLD